MTSGSQDSPPHNCVPPRPLLPKHARPWIKICGNLRTEDSFLVASHHPDFMGWIFSHFSPRRIDPQKAARLITGIRNQDPSIRHVGVFAGNSVPSILDINHHLKADGAPLDFLQITDGAGFIRSLREAMRRRQENTPVLPVVRPTGILQDDLFLPTAPSSLWVLDRFDPIAKGGTGQRIPGEFFQPVKYPFLLAGGIRPENAREALQESGAVGIDVSSGLESGPGFKDPARVEALFRALRP